MIDINEFLNPVNLDSLLETVLQNSSQVQMKTNNVYPDDEDNLITQEYDYLQDSAFKISGSNLSVSNLTEAERNAIAEQLYQSYKTARSTATTVKNKQTIYSDDSTTTEISSDTETSNKNSSINIFNFSSLLGNGLEELKSSLDNELENVFSSLQEVSSDILADTKLGGVLKGIISAVGDQFRNYQDGVSETSFGMVMEDSWYGGVRSNFQAFLDYFQKMNKGKSRESRKINILSSTPLDSGSEQRSALYGSMMLGAPFLFNNYADTNNRALINTLIKDGKFLTLTPGFPKYNGMSYNTNIKDNPLYQTPTANSMLDYITKNGLDSTFSDKDKRYYTFKTDYKAYFAYLETMLNAVWIKLGLAKNGNTFNLFSFFKIKDADESGGIDPASYNELLSQYESSIGFFTNIASVLSESISNSQTSFGSELGDKANTRSNEYQRLNYMTGMGTGGAGKNIMRRVGIGIRTVSNIGEDISDAFKRTSGALGDVRGSSGIKAVLNLVKVAGSMALDIAEFTNTNDLGALIQSYATTNGMKVVYPELWSDSSYSKNLTFNFTFTSPYGDPLSIFRYVYVPFFALLAFGMPRQAAENGYVSPFLVRAHVPGLFTSDLAFISDITWTKGGGSALWTKDGLPRSIDVSITLTDLYPYLSMTKRLSYLSANPSYTVFLDSFAGMLASTDNSDDDVLNRYFEELLTRINGTNIQNENTMWNKFNTAKSKLTEEISNRVKGSVSATVDPYSVPWLHNSSL